MEEVVERVASFIQAVLHLWPPKTELPCRL